MTNRAIGRVAVLVLAGAFMFAAVPVVAASADSSSAVVSKHHKKVRVAHRRNRDDADGVKDTAKTQTKVETKPEALPTDVADARAQMTGDEAKTRAAADASVQLASASTTESAAQDPAVQVVNADELNDLDKAATDVTDLPKLPPSVANSRAEMRIEGPSPWAQTSTIGKAFVAFGVMLTLASAARMFMA